MSVTAIGNYEFASSDREENFHGNWMVHVLWEQHLLYANPVSVPLPPSMPFAAVIENLLPQLYGEHPEYEKIQWDAVEWTLDGVLFQPNPSASLAECGFTHKSLLRFRTPGLSGLYGAGF